MTKKKNQNAVLVKSSVVKFLNSPGAKYNFKHNKQLLSWGGTDNTNTCSEPGPCVLMEYQKKTSEDCCTWKLCWKTIT